MNIAAFTEWLQARQHRIYVGPCHNPYDYRKALLRTSWQKKSPQHRAFLRQITQLNHPLPRHNWLPSLPEPRRYLRRLTGNGRVTPRKR